MDNSVIKQKLNEFKIKLRKKKINEEISFNRKNFLNFNKIFEQ